jgi:cytidine deaminase
MVSDENWERMYIYALWARDHADPNNNGKTKVGAAVLNSYGYIFVGVNIPHRYRCHDIHAEVSALAYMSALGEGPAVGIVVVADRDKFTPCGSCMDWIFELGGPDCQVRFQPMKGDPITFTAKQLMPEYPA